MTTISPSGSVAMATEPDGENLWMDGRPQGAV